MGNSSTCDCQASLVRWLREIGVRNPASVEQILYQQNITSVEDLLYVGKDLDDLLSHLDLIGDRSKIKKALVKSGMVLNQTITNTQSDNNNNNNNNNNNKGRNGNKHRKTFGNNDNGLNGNLDFEFTLDPDENSCRQEESSNVETTVAGISKHGADISHDIGGVNYEYSDMQDNGINLVNNNDIDDTNDNSGNIYKNDSDDNGARNGDEIKINNVNGLKCDNFEFVNRIDNSISRMDLRRPMILGMFDKGSLDHSKIRLIYFSKVLKKNNNYNNSNNNELLVRVFSIDLYKNSENGNNILSIEGPLSENVYFDNYKCKKYFTISNMSINDLIDIAKETMEKHGKYNVLLNNCRDYSKQLMENVEKGIKNNTGYKFSLCNNNKQVEIIRNEKDCWVLQTYINEYFDNNFKYSPMNRDGDGYDYGDGDGDGDLKQDLFAMDNDSDADVESDDSYKQQENERLKKANKNKNKKKSKSKGNNNVFVESKAISFDLVEKEFNMRYKYNNIKIVKQGYLHKKSRHLNVWKNRYCVLTANYMLYTFKNCQMRNDPTECIKIKGQMVQADDQNKENGKNNIFYVNTFVFKAETDQCKWNWINAIKTWGGRSSNVVKMNVATVFS